MEANPSLADFVQFELARVAEADGDLAEAQRLYAALAQTLYDPIGSPGQAVLIDSAETRARLLSVAMGQPVEDDASEADGDSEETSE